MTEEHKVYVGQSVGTGRNFSILANAISDAIYAASLRGMEIDEAVCCAASVLADYGRCVYGPEYLNNLAQIVIERGKDPMPDLSAQPLPDEG